MNTDWLRLDEERVLIEQLRLVLKNIASALIPTLFLSTLLVWALYNDSNATALVMWGVALMSYKLFAALHARHYLASGNLFGKAHQLVWSLMILNMMDGAIWASLAWVTLDTSTTAGSILVISTIAGMVGSALSRLSAVMPVFLAFVATMLVLLALKVSLLGDPAYNALGVVSIIYLTSITLMGRNGAREIAAAIKLRFENIALLEQLQLKTEMAEAAQREAEQANAAKSKFLAAASHDLRQPIHAQGLFLEVLSRTELTDQQRDVLASARTASEASGEMLNTLLDFSRIEAGVIEPHVQPFRLQPLLNKIESELAPQADAKNIVYRSRETHDAVRSDPVLLELILRNLISNAIRYTEHGGVLIGCRRRSDHVLLEIWDTGIGIAPEHQQEIFREFHQLGNPERDRRKGLGLGLAITKGLVNALGHDLALRSIPQHGSVFRLSIPIADPALVEQTASVLPMNRLLNVRVLVIDDDETVRTGMCHLLQDWGCVCMVAESIEEATRLARVHSLDLVISDYRLREQRTGVEAITALRSIQGDTLPALLITGDTAPERLREAQASGVQLLHKPVSPEQLFRKSVEALNAAPGGHDSSTTEGIRGESTGS